MTSILKLYIPLVIAPFIFLIVGFSSIDQTYKILIWPTLTITLVFIIFTAVLQNLVKENVISEIGFIHFIFLIIYTLFPASILIFDALDEGSPLAWLNANREDMALHLWRHVLFSLAFSISFLLTRGKETILTKMPQRQTNDDFKIIMFCFIFLLLSYLVIISLSAPVYDYYSQYTKFDHLPPILRSLVSIAIRLNWGFATILLVFLFLNFNRFKYSIPLALIFLIFMDLYITSGARIQSFIMLTSVLCLFCILVKKIKFTRLVVYGITFLIFFTFLAIIRLSPDEAFEPDVAAMLLTIGGEFGAVFYTGFVLYSDRASDILPIAPWQMFFYDFWALIPFFDVYSWTPMNWFYLNYHPDAPVAPFTLGPIANSAIWGGEVDLFLRGILSGFFFSAVTIFFNKNRDSWVAILIYVFCFSTTILIMKYSIFFHTQLILKTLLPALFICWILTKVKFTKAKA